MAYQVNPTKREEGPKEAEKREATQELRKQGVDVKEDAKETEKGDPRKSRLIELTRRTDLSPIEKTERDALAAEYPGFDAEKVGR